LLRLTTMAEPRLELQISGLPGTLICLLGDLGAPDAG
jgi:hypothetical protein